MVTLARRDRRASRATGPATTLARELATNPFLAGPAPRDPRAPKGTDRRPAARVGPLAARCCAPSTTWPSATGTAWCSPRSSRRPSCSPGGWARRPRSSTSRCTPSPTRGAGSLTLRPEATASVVRAYLQAGGTGRAQGAPTRAPCSATSSPRRGGAASSTRWGSSTSASRRPTPTSRSSRWATACSRPSGSAARTVLLNSLGDPADRVGYRDLLAEFLTEARRPPVARTPAAAWSPTRCGCSTARPMPPWSPTPRSPSITSGPRPPRTSPRCAPGSTRRGIALRDRPAAGARPRLLQPHRVRVPVARRISAAQDALGGGGRYDPLAELLGGPATPGVGLAMGVDRIVAAMPARGGRGASLDRLRGGRRPRSGAPTASDLVRTLRAPAAERPTSIWAASR